MNKFKIFTTPIFNIKHHIAFIAFLFILNGKWQVLAQDKPDDLTKYTPAWIKDGFANAGASHEPWIFQVRRNSPNFNQWQKEEYDYQLSKAFIKELAIETNPHGLLRPYRYIRWLKEKENKAC